MPYHEKIPYIRCGTCRFKKQNTRYEGPRITAGDFCPRCGTQLTKYNELTRQSRVLAGDQQRDRDTWTPPSRQELAAKAVGMGISLAVVYGMFRLLISTAGDQTITINGETAPLFDPGIANAAFVLVVIVAAIAFVLPYAPGYVKHRRLA